MLVFFLIFSQLPSFTTSLQVLFFTIIFGRSHLDFADSLINTLVDSGHTVDLVISRINDNARGNGKNQAERVYTIEFTNGSTWGNASHLTDPFKKRVQTYGSFREYSVIGNDLCQISLNDDQLFDFLSVKRYDIAIVSSFDYCILGIVQQIGIPSIATMSAVPLLPIQAVSMGLPNLASIYTPLFLDGHVKSLSGKMWNLLDWTYLNFVQIPEIKSQQLRMFEKKYGSGFDIDKLMRSVDISFINSNEIMEMARPIHDGIKYIGGINLRDPKPLNEQFDRLLSQSTKGTIIFSFGTQVPSEVYPRYAVRNFVTIFKKYHDYTFLWKYDIQEGEEKLFADAHNVFTLDWLPQTDLLYDPRMIGFISHVGLNSFNEASYAGKPIVAIPLFADQPHNAENGVLRGTTYLLDKTDLNEDSIDKGISAIINDPSYRKNAAILSKMLNEKPSQPKDRFVKWVEFAAANPGLHKIFELPGARMSVFEFYCIDVILSMIFAPIFATFGALFLITRKFHMK